MSNNFQQGQQASEGSQTVQIPTGNNVLKLRATENKSPKLNNQGVRWKTNVIDNENMNKKKTKICCIYHPNIEDEEDDVDENHCSEHTHDDIHDDIHEESSSSSSESDNEKNLDFNERRKRRVERRQRKLRENSNITPNAYEVQPDYSEYRKKIQNKQ